MARASAARNVPDPRAKLPFRVERTHARCLTIRFDVGGREWERWVLLRTDAHHDNQHSDHELEQIHLKEAQERDAAILDAGDLFCCMEGKWDKRADQNALRPEMRGNNYLDLVKKYNAEFYAPWAPWLAMVSPGNHETAMLRHHQTDLTAGLAERIAVLGGVQPEVMPYTGWVRFVFEGRGRRSESKALYYTHGYGGGGPVTLDVIQTNRQAVYLGDVDLVWSGHTHDEFRLTRMREQLDHNGVPGLREIEFVKTPGYKDEFSPGEGFHSEKGRPPKPKGAAWLRFTRRFRYGGQREAIVVETMRAK